MLKRFLSWFRKDYAKASAEVLTAFDQIKKDLQKLNLKMLEVEAKNLEKIVELQDHNLVLRATNLKNSKVVHNLEALLGEGGEPMTDAPSVTK